MGKIEMSSFCPSCFLCGSETKIEPFQNSPTESPTHKKWELSSTVLQDLKMEEYEREEQDLKPSVVERLIQVVDGFPIPSQGFEASKFRDVLRAEYLESDIILSTYPKVGTTWTQYVIWGVLNDGAIPPSVNQLMLKIFPFLEFMGIESLENLEEPRLIKLHLPFDLMPPSSLKSRLIHVLRNPFDVCVSFWSHLLEIDVTIMGAELPFDDFFEAFMEGNVMFGNYFQHEITWYEHRNDPNVLFLTYEFMKEDPKAAIQQVADFLGHGEKMREDEEVLDNVVKHSSFNYLKENCMFRIAKDQESMEKMGEDYWNLATSQEVSSNNYFRTINFFRKGQVGTGSEKLSDEQWKRLEDAIEENVSDPELKELMKPPPRNKT